MPPREGWMSVTLEESKNSIIPEGGWEGGVDGRGKGGGLGPPLRWGVGVIICEGMGRWVEVGGGLSAPPPPP